MKLRGKKIIGGKAGDIIKEMQNDKHSKDKWGFMHKSKNVAKKHSK